MTQPGSSTGSADAAARLSAAEQFWSAAFEAGGIDTWLSEPRVRSYVNESISGCADEWPVDCFRRLYVRSPFKNALSIGCGEGALERDVRRKNISRRITGIDISASALASARAAASREKLRRIKYRRADFNRFRLPRNRYDLVFFHQSMHHVAQLEHCFAQVVKTLRPEGFLYLDEYVGPSRDRWSEALLADANRVFRELPAELRRGDEIPPPIEFDDPSEAIRSAEIVPMTYERFRVLHQRDYGGNLLALIYPLVKWEAMAEERKEEILERLIAEERRLLAAGAPSYYTVILARHR